MEISTHTCIHTHIQMQQNKTNEKIWKFQQEKQTTNVPERLSRAKSIIECANGKSVR